MKTRLNKIITIFAIGITLGMPAFASPIGNYDTNGPGAIALDIIIMVFGLVAPILIFFGAYKIALGFGGNKPEEQTKGVQMAVSGIMIQAIVATSALWTGRLINTPDFSTLDVAIKTLLNWITGLGAALLVYGLIKMAIAFQNDDAGGRTKAFQQAITGGILIGLQTIIGTVTATSGFNLTAPAPGSLNNTAGIALMFKGAFIFIGSAMVIFGAIHLAQSFSKEDADAKVVGTRWMVAGVIVIAIGNAASNLGINF